MLDHVFLKVLSHPPLDMFLRAFDHHLLSLLELCLVRVLRYERDGAIILVDPNGMVLFLVFYLDLVVLIFVQAGQRFRPFHVVASFLTTT